MASSSFLSKAKNLSFLCDLSSTLSLSMALSTEEVGLLNVWKSASNEISRQFWLQQQSNMLYMCVYVCIPFFFFSFGLAERKHPSCHLANTFRNQHRTARNTDYHCTYSFTSTVSFTDYRITLLKRTKYWKKSNQHLWGIHLKCINKTIGLH